jgi:hypothetical protein
MRHFVLRWARSFGTQSDKDFFFHNLAKTGEVARPLRRVVATLLLICSLAAAASVFVARPHALVVKCADTRRHRRATRPRPTPSARRSLPLPLPPPPPCSFQALNCPQVLILYRDIIRTARVMTHKDNGAARAAAFSSACSPRRHVQMASRGA